MFVNSYFFKNPEMRWFVNSKIVNPYQTNFQNRFATHVDVYGDTLLIGTAFSDLDSQDAGRAFAYKKVLGSWSLDQEIPPAVVGFRARFGTSVHMNSDQAAIYSISPNAIHIYDRTLPTWQLLASITPPSEHPNSRFGYYYAEFVHLLENLLVVIGNLDYLDATTACVFCYTRSGATWSLFNTIMISSEAGLTFTPKSISSDGNFIAVGGLKSPSSLAEGEVYSEIPCVKLYELNGGSWTLHQTLTSPYPYDGQWMQGKVTVSMFSGAICVGWPYGIENSLDQSGSAEVYRLFNDMWNLEANIENPHPSQWAWFGEYMELSSDRLIISAYGDDAGGEYRGAVYCYIRRGPNWILNDTIIGPPAPNYTEQFGLAVSLSGEHLAVLDYRDGTNTEWQSVVYTYDWTEIT